MKLRTALTVATFTGLILHISRDAETNHKTNVLEPFQLERSIKFTPSQAVQHFDNGLFYIEEGNLISGIKTLNELSKQIPKILQTLPKGNIYFDLLGKYYDCDLYLGKAYLEQSQYAQDTDKRIDLLLDAECAIGDYIWSHENHPDYAVLGYPELIRITKELTAFHESEYPLNEIIDMFLNETNRKHGWQPLWNARGNPKSLPAIFETSQLCVEFQATHQARNRLATHLLTELQSRIRLDPNPDYYMVDHHNLELARYCSKVAAMKLPEGFDTSFRRQGQEFLALVPKDPTKSPYARQAKKLARDLK